MLPLMYHDSKFLQFNKLEQQEESGPNTYVLILLNYEMPLLTLFLWNKACCRICADGGANRLYDCLPTILSCDDPFEVRKQYKPDVIKGDLDSIRPEVRDFYAGLGTTIVDESHDQDSTDLFKCISYVKDKTPSIENCNNVKILVLAAFGGRIDHFFSNLNALYCFPSIRIILLNDESMAYLLSKDFSHEIHINPTIEGPHCGLVPLGGPSAGTTTTGLRWNLDKTPMKFGGLISTSNIYENEIVTVSPDTDLVWTISIQQLSKHLREILGSK